MMRCLEGEGVLIKSFNDSMRGFLFIVLVSISANLFAQQKGEYFVKNDGDTVYCGIKKIDIDKIKLSSTILGKNVWPVDSLKCFRYNSILWNTYSYPIEKENGGAPAMDKIFLPQLYTNINLRLGNWGPALGAKSFSQVYLTSDGKSVLYDVITTENSAPEILIKSRLFLKKMGDSGLIRIPFLPKPGFLTSKTKKEEVKKMFPVIKAYLAEITKDKPRFNKPVINENLFPDYDRVKSYIISYLLAK